MSPKLKRIFKVLSYIFALLAGSSLTSCNFMNLGPVVY